MTAKQNRPGRPPDARKAPPGSFAARLAAARRRAKLSVEEAAAAVGVTPGAWYAWERGRVRDGLREWPEPSYRLALKLAAALKCTLVDLFPKA